MHLHENTLCALVLLIPPVVPSLICCMPWIVEHPVVREYDVPRMLRQSLARPGALADSRVFFGIIVQKAHVLSCWKRGWQGFAPLHIQRLLQHVQRFLFSRDHTRSLRLSFHTCHGTHHERTSFPENTSFAWKGRLFTQQVKGC